MHTEPDDHHGHDHVSDDHDTGGHGSDAGGHGSDAGGHMSDDHVDRGHEHDHDAQGHGHDHGAGDHGHRRGRLGGLVDRFTGHSHDPGDQVDDALESSARGLRALRLSVLVLGVTALLQGVAVVASHSVALLGDTLHNLADALTAVPLALAFTVGRRPPDRRYTYGYGRAEDLAGISIVLAIAISSLVAGWESIQRLLHPNQVHHLGAVAAASLLGFAGNELVALYRIKVGRDIGSAALVADGLHARTDGLTSLAVLVGAGGVALGWRVADPVVGIVITLAIAVVFRSAARDVYRRLMDAVDPALVEQVERVVASTDGVNGVGTVRLRWIGHSLHAEVPIVLDGSLTVAQGHDISEHAAHHLLHEVPKLADAFIHAEPSGIDDPHAATNHHRPR